jgi:hypothetical protein
MKTFVTALSLVIFAATALAQNGYINIQNNLATTFHTNTVASGGSSGNIIGSFYFEVLTAPSTVTSVDAALSDLLSGTWSDTGVSGTNSGTGREIGGGTTSANNWGAGVQQSFIVVGWSGNLGSTWAQVRDEALVPILRLQAANGSYFWAAEDILYSGFLGATTVGSAIAGQDASSAAFLFGRPVVSDPQVPIPILTTTELYEIAVPEPGMLAFTSMGVGGLLLFRRRLSS